MKVIIQLPYAVKPDRKKEILENLQAQWESGLMLVDGCAKIIIRPDEDLLITQFKEEPTDGISSNG